jgi:hypothetical protein
MDYWIENRSRIPVQMPKPPDEANGVDDVILQGNNNPGPAMDGKVPEGITQVCSVLMLPTMTIICYQTSYYDP